MPTNESTAGAALQTSLNHNEALAVISHRRALARNEGGEVPMLMCGNCGTILRDTSGAHLDGSSAKDCCSTSAVLVDARTVQYNKEYTAGDGTVVPAGSEIVAAVHIPDRDAEIARLQAQIDRLTTTSV